MTVFALFVLIALVAAALSFAPRLGVLLPISVVLLCIALLAADSHTFRR